ncbi:DUF6249 domain-containing protein [Thalassotalea sp. Y01]|uniref:DUF6249 domain-containing protein n=1 Tax=Thalassotalea sp. Y01 TaxID=2729613 RepID=UPI00145D6EC2|nr:DUF6249 domain-containing protein [Thalassotalea sp. Y01]NMP15068.1 hypothetical protein [Thalassotalea sp. Y01]
MMEELVPIVLFVTTGVVAWLFLFYAYKNKMALQQTIQKALDNGQALSPESIEKILHVQRNPKADFKRGILLVSLAVGIALYAWISTADADMAGIAMFPLTIGVGYLLVYRFADKS